MAGAELKNGEENAGVRFKKVEFRVTEDCNRRGGPCRDKCFSDHTLEGWPITADPTLEEIEFMFGRIQAAGIPVVNIVGGEALLRADVVDILRMGEENFGFRMILTTNCDLLSREALEQIAPHIEFLSISLDGSNEQANDRLRGEGHFLAAQRIIEAYDPERHGFRLKVNTVVSKANLRDGSLDDLPAVFQRKPVILKFIQFTPRGNGLGVRDQYAISGEEFDGKVEEIMRRYPGVYICKRTYEEYEPPDVLIIRPNGLMLINVGEQHLIVGDIYRDDVSSVIQQVVQNYPAYIKENSDEFAGSYPVFPA